MTIRALQAVVRKPHRALAVIVALALCLGGFGAGAYLGDVQAGSPAPAGGVGATPPPLVLEQAGLTAFALSADGKTVATVDGDSVARVWDLQTGRKISQTAFHPGSVPRLAFSPDGSRLICCCDGGDAPAFLWDAATGKRTAIATEELPRGRTHGMAVSADGKWFATCRSDGWLKRYEAPSGSQDGGVSWADNVPLFAVAFSPDSRLLASGDQDGNIAMQDMLARNKSQRWRGHRDAATALAFAPDGKLLASAGADGTVCLWNAANGKLVRQWAGHKGKVHSLTFLDADTILSAGADRSLWTWEVASAKPLRKLLADIDGDLDVAVSANGKWLAAASKDGRIRVWALDVLREAPRSNLKLRAEQLDELWKDLACDDAVRRFRAMTHLTFGAGQAVPFLDKRLAPAKGEPIPAEITRLLKDLDDRTYAVRDKARRELEKRGKTVERYLRLELAKGPSLEVERSLTLLLAKLGPASAEPLSIEHQRDLLVVRVLEHIGTAEARAVLERLAGGSPESEQTRQAVLALRRLKAAKGP